MEHGSESRAESRGLLGFCPWSNWEEFPFSEMGSVQKEGALCGGGERRGCIGTVQGEPLPALPKGAIGQAVDRLRPAQGRDAGGRHGVGQGEACWWHWKLEEVIGGGHRRERAGPWAPPTLTEGTRQPRQAEPVVSGARRTRRKPHERVIAGRRDGGELHAAYGSGGVDSWVSRPAAASETGRSRGAGGARAMPGLEAKGREVFANPRSSEPSGESRISTETHNIKLTATLVC